MSTNRDIEDDFINAYLAERDAYTAAGDFARAQQVDDALADLGHVGKPVPVSDKETAVSPEPLETAVEAPKKRGRPRKVAEEAPESE